MKTSKLRMAATNGWLKVSSGVVRWCTASFVFAVPSLLEAWRYALHRKSLAFKGLTQYEPP